MTRNKEKQNADVYIFQSIVSSLSVKRLSICNLMRELFSFVRAVRVKSQRRRIEMRRIIATLFLFIIGLEAIDLQCRLGDNEWTSIVGIGCKASNVNITSRQIITSVNGQKNLNGSNYITIDIDDQVVNFIPEGLGKFFPNIEGLSITASKLKKVEKKDLQQFPNLKMLYLSSNDLKFLPDDLFEGNLELQSFSLFANPVTHIGHNLVTPLMKLEAAIFPKGSCIDQFYFRPKLSSLPHDLKTKCSEPTQEMIEEVNE
jgi:hypothetical protein